MSDSLVVAMGGATEASIWSNHIDVPHQLPIDWISIPYGTALKGQMYKVVDKFDRVCPNNVVGELHIGGLGVAKGYIGDQQLTEENSTMITIMLSGIEQVTKVVFGMMARLNFR